MGKWTVPGSQLRVFLATLAGGRGACTQAFVHAGRGGRLSTRCTHLVYPGTLAALGKGLSQVNAGRCEDLCIVHACEKGQCNVNFTLVCGANRFGG